jgi:hypothetical protein
MVILFVAYPFKFNHGCLKEESFCDLVWSVWNNNEVTEGFGAQLRLTKKLSRLKEQVKIWLVDKKKKELSAFNSIELEITHLTKRLLDFDCCQNLSARLKLLEHDRNKLLLAEEERWRLKSRALWIKSGDKNTKFFHHYASYRWNKKHIWEVKDDSDKFIMDRMP